MFPFLFTKTKKLSSFYPKILEKPFDGQTSSKNVPYFLIRTAYSNSKNNIT
jgi:hypothetical protein